MTANRTVPAHRRARDWHGATQHSVANPRRTRRLGRDGLEGRSPGVEVPDTRDDAASQHSAAR